MSLTSQSVQLGPRADKSLVIVVCTDAEGNTHNEYVRDATLRKSLADATERTREATESTILSRASQQIFDRANPPTPADDRNE